jgi:hypothetical protein
MFSTMWRSSTMDVDNSSRRNFRAFSAAVTNPVKMIHVCNLAGQKVVFEPLVPRLTHSFQAALYLIKPYKQYSNDSANRRNSDAT